MIAKTFTLLLVLGVAVARDLAGVDPNTLTCDPRGQEFLLLPHFKDCDKFYMCAHGDEVEFSCPGGTIFDFPLQTCNHAWATKCWLRTTEEVESSIEEIEGSGQEVEGSGEGSADFEWFSSDVQAPVEPTDVLNQLTGTVRASGKAPAAKPVLPQSHFAAILDCSNARDATRMMPYKGDCQRYWRCLDGLLTTVYCSDGLFFNERTQQCDFEANVKCSVNQDDELQGEFMIYK